MMEEAKKKVPTVTSIITGDPLANSAIGRTISWDRARFGGSDASMLPQGVINWGAFEGAILGLCLKRAEEILYLGSAVIIAPGLAITAVHVYSEHLDEIMNASAVLYGLGVASARVDYWKATRISDDTENDIAFLSLELNSPIHNDGGLTAFPLTTRTPRLGERISIVGFRMQCSYSTTENALRTEGQLYMAAGEVEAVYMKRDAVLMPYPVIEIKCGALGGMSGGAVLDDAGMLLGVVSKSLATEDGLGPVFASWIIGGLNRKLDIPWPPGMYETNVHLLEINERALQIEGREHVILVNDNQFSYNPWDTRAQANVKTD